MLDGVANECQAGHALPALQRLGHASQPTVGDVDTLDVHAHAAQGVEVINTLGGGYRNSKVTSTGTAAGLVAGHQAPAPRPPTLLCARSPLTSHSAQPVCACFQVQLPLSGLQDGLAVEPANRSGVQLGAGGRQADLAGRRQGGRSGPRQRTRRGASSASASSTVANLQPLRELVVRLLRQAQEIHRRLGRHPRLGDYSLYLVATLLQPFGGV